MVKKWQNRPTWEKKLGKTVFGIRPSVSFCSASVLAKNFDFGASIRSNGIKVYSLGINTYSSDQIVAVASMSMLQ